MNEIRFGRNSCVKGLRGLHTFPQMRVLIPGQRTPILIAGDQTCWALQSYTQNKSTEKPSIAVKPKAMASFFQILELRACAVTTPMTAARIFRLRHSEGNKLGETRTKSEDLRFCISGSQDTQNKAEEREGWWLDLGPGQSAEF